MNDDQQHLDGLSAEEHMLAERLSRLGELMRELQRTEDEVDSPFTRTLRAHLLHGEELAPHPVFARRLRAQLLRRRGARSVPRPRQRHLLSSLPLLAALVAAVVLLSQLGHGSSFHVPYPTKVDLLFNLPSTRSTVARVVPTLSLIHPSTDTPFLGQVRLSAPHLSRSTAAQRAYRLGAKPDIVARARRLLAINAPVRRVRMGGASWLVAADGGLSRQPLHSLALSLTTGELIYHDRRNFLLPRSQQPVTRAAAIRSARGWLTWLGWAGRTMPVRRVGHPAGLPKVCQVELGWQGVQRTTIEAATLWVTPDHSIIEAWVWPPVAASGHVPVRLQASAWADITSHAAPLVVSGVASDDRGVVKGRVLHVSAVLILVPGRQGAPYLVPAYRFVGTARVGSSTQKHPWAGLAPAVQR